LTLVSAGDDLDAAIERSHQALAEFVRGNPEPLKACYSHRDDVSIANPFFGARRGWDLVAEAMEGAAANYRDGDAVGFERIAENVTSELAYIVEIERYQARIGGGEERSEVALRVTTVLRPEDAGWKIIHRHADPITARRPAESVIRG
jgi:ketosteroid isomerase-like protein